MKVLTALVLWMLLSCQSASARFPIPSFPTAVELQPTQTKLTKRGDYRYVYRMFFKLYDAALYANKDATTNDILEAKTNYRLQFRYLREIDRSIILESSTKILRKNLSSEQLSQISARVDRLNAAYRTVQKGDLSSLTYQTGIGTTLSINGRPVITIEGEDFARLYFTIWLGEQAISNSLRQNLLGLYQASSA